MAALSFAIRSALKLHSRSRVTYLGQIFVLGLSGANIVLRVQWLQELGLILTDYTSRTMNFSMLDPQLQLTADMPL